MNKLITYDQVTIIGHESHSYIFEDLEPGQPYEIKLEAFNFAGSSPPSRISRKSTLKLVEDQDQGAARWVVSIEVGCFLP